MLQMAKLTNTSLSRADARRLLDETPHVLDRELSVGTGKIFALADGRALVFAERGHSMLYPSRDELAAAYRADLERIKQGYSPMQEMLPQGEGFAAVVPELLRDAPARLGIDAAALDFSVESVALVDKAVRRLGQTKVLSPEVFPSLLAYVGEVVRRRVAAGRRWEMRLGDDGRTWEPWIVDTRGNHFPVLGINAQLSEEDDPRSSSSLREFVEELTPIPAETMQSNTPGSVSGGLGALLGRAVKWVKRS